ncbi:hypothetical protein DAPPUDRAFT_278668 [Daphnia pulex]|uniref:Uncharacterized protein n=1 Tax=Daphnia pulex TaxID=6669 RepID=E9I707_DAPPU|nr:hypothetical protein DAPPUDRAFT_278668 [Daphnia pulex]|eukprot:EFX60223.1 hypothetical protein DAPPUDRAFT_278668 [Daphnia pulex]
MPRSKRVYKRVIYAESSSSSTVANPQVRDVPPVVPLSLYGCVPNCRVLFRPRSAAVPKPSWLRSASGGWPFRPRSAAVPKPSWLRSASGGWPFWPRRPETKLVSKCLCAFRRLAVLAPLLWSRSCGHSARCALHFARLSLPWCPSPRPRRHQKGDKA